MHGPLNSNEIELKISHIWKNNNWDWTTLSLQIPTEINTKTLATTIPNTPGYTDKPYWALSSNGLFSTKSVYSLLHNRPYVPYKFKWIWTLHTLGKIKFFLWLCSHNRLPTRACLHHIGINIEQNFAICTNPQETIHHIFFESPIAVKFWQDINLNSLNLPYQQTHWLQALRDVNISLQHNHLQWLDFLPFVLWHIWLNRNRNTFENTRHFLLISIPTRRSLEFKYTTLPRITNSIKKLIHVN